MIKEMDKFELSVSKKTDCTNETESNCDNDKKYGRKKKLNPNDKDNQPPYESKIQRRDDSVIQMTAEEIRQIAYNNLYKFTNNNSSLEKPKSLQDWVNHCKNVIQNPVIYESPKVPQRQTANHNITRNNTNFVHYAQPLARNFVSSSSAVVNTVKLDELYPISKGDIHKISEEPSVSELKPSTVDITSPPPTSQHLATIINCPLDNTYGARLLTKMGWRFGEGLGKDRDGIVKAVKFEAKIDRRGLATPVEKFQSKVKKPDVDKNPVSMLMEFCQKRKISPPVYEDVEEVGPSNQRQFRISVTILNNTYLSPSLYKTKKDARAGSASIAAKELNLL